MDSNKELLKQKILEFASRNMKEDSSGISSMIILDAKERDVNNQTELSKAI